jgi:Uma2 family endonuclease
MSEKVAIAELKETPTVPTTKPRKRRRLPLPLTFEERAAMGKREVRVPATFEEYLVLSHDCDYRVHYRNGHIISFIEIDEKTKTIMGEASVTHERIVMRIGHFLAEILGFDSEYQIMGSNAKIFIADDRKGCNPDVVVTKGEAELKQYKYNRRTMKGITNPWLIVEVLSDSTRDFDLAEKLSDYKQITTLQQVIFLEQNSLWASTYIRRGANEWLNIDFNSPDGQIPVGDGFMELGKIYSKIL